MVFFYASPDSCLTDLMYFIPTTIVRVEDRDEWDNICKWKDTVSGLVFIVCVGESSRDYPMGPAVKLSLKHFSSFGNISEHILVTIEMAIYGLCLPF